jgi:hypothetical protein
LNIVLTQLSVPKNRVGDQMTRIWIVWVTLAIIVGVGFFLFVWRAKRNETSEVAGAVEKAAAVVAAETRAYDLRALRKVAWHDYFGGIGSLVEMSRWKETLSLSEPQKVVIAELDELLWDAHLNSLLADADYKEGNSADYKEYANNRRRETTVEHGVRVVSIGLLTEAQAAYVIQRNMTFGRPGHALGDSQVQELLGMTPRQKMEFAEVWERANHDVSRLAWDAISEEANATAMTILTPAQRETWTRLSTGHPAPSAPPDLPALSTDESARIKLEELSPTFRVLTKRANDLKLSDEQQRLLQGLSQVIKTGLFWMKITNRDLGNGVAETRTKFLTHAEQIALLGIMTESQARQVQTVVGR